jgi:hypothetical protein
MYYSVIQSTQYQLCMSQLNIIDILVKMLYKYFLICFLYLLSMRTNSSYFFKAICEQGRKRSLRAREGRGPPQNFKFLIGIYIVK